MNSQDLIDLRKRLGFTQAEMATAMALGGRAYQNLEAGEEISERHIMLAEYASLRRAVERKDISMALPSVRATALDLAELIRGAPKNAKSPPHA